MSLAADLEQAPTYRGTRPCTFKSWLASLPEDERAAVRTALLRKDTDPLYWATPALHERLVAAGWGGSEATTYKHRNPEACRSCR